MYRMSQKLLEILFFLLLSFSYVYGDNWGLVNSIETGPYGIHLKLPLGIFYENRSKRIYVVDSGNSRLISYNFNGKPLKEFNAGGQLKYPVGMVKDNNGNLWIIERESNNIIFINLHKKKIVKYSLDIFPEKIEIFKKNLVILDRYSGKIFLYNLNLKLKKIIFPNDKKFKGFFDIKIKGTSLLAMETLTGRIFVFNLEDDTYKIIQPKQELIEPVSFDMDKNGNIYLLDRFLQKVFIFDNKGDFFNTQLKGGNRQGELYYPWYIKIVDDKILILDEGNGRVDIFKY